MRTYVTAFCICLFACGQGWTPKGQNAVRTSSAVHEDLDVVRVVANLLGRGECDEAMSRLSRERNRSPVWYELMSRASECRWRAYRTDVDRSRAIEVLDEGLAKFPANANLILSKGYRYETFGEVEKALQTFRAAISVSETNAMTRPEDAESSRDIAAAAAREKSSLERKLSASAASGLTTDEMWLAINAGKCEAVLNALQNKSTSAWSAEDYQLSYAAHAACWSSTGAESHKEGALRSVVDGLKAFPDSAELLSNGAFFEEKLGDRRAAAQYFQRFAAACKARAGRCAPDAQQMIAEHLRSLGASTP